MKRILYLHKKSKEIEHLLNGQKDVIIRAANIKKYPYKMIEKGYLLYLLQNDKSELVYCSAVVKEAIFYEVSNNNHMDEIIAKYKDRAKLSKQKLEYIKKRKYISLFILDQIKETTGKIDHSRYGEVDDWVVLIK